MGDKLRSAGAAVFALGVIFFLLPLIGIQGHPGPPNLWLYLGGGGAALYLLGWLIE